MPARRRARTCPERRCAEPGPRVRARRPCAKRRAGRSIVRLRWPAPSIGCRWRHAVRLAQLSAGCQRPGSDAQDRYTLMDVDLGGSGRPKVACGFPLPAFARTGSAGMTEEGVPAGAVRTIIPACIELPLMHCFLLDSRLRGNDLTGACAVIPATAGMIVRTAYVLRPPCRHSRDSGNDGPHGICPKAPLPSFPRRRESTIWATGMLLCTLHLQREQRLCYPPKVDKWSWLTARGRIASAGSRIGNRARMRASSSGSMCVG